jgi:small acid-soluble spore protein B (major beta-type SASP)
MSKKNSSKSSSRLDSLKNKFAKETGVDISQYNNLDKANLTSRQNGYVGGYIGGMMTKKLVEMSEQQLAEK